jgi:hypothetical protein
MKERTQKEIDWEKIEMETTKMDCGESCECTRSSIRFTTRVMKFFEKKFKAPQ